MQILFMDRLVSKKGWYRLRADGDKHYSLNS